MSHKWILITVRRLMSKSSFITLHRSGIRLLLSYLRDTFLLHTVSKIVEYLYTNVCSHIHTWLGWLLPFRIILARGK